MKNNVSWELSPAIVARHFLKNVNGLDTVRVPMDVVQFLRPKTKRFPALAGAAAAAAGRAAGSGSSDTQGGFGVPPEGSPGGFGVPRMDLGSPGWIWGRFPPPHLTGAPRHCPIPRAGFWGSLEPHSSPEGSLGWIWGPRGEFGVPWMDLGSPG
ncbi:large ribosomal subunit protein bL9m [Prinia subflava]|uniref:large ribosomal subunit protein bL9m n=1 Tax=Prinia subflava TaxID=208062 RepID=UPI002FE33F03